MGGVRTSASAEVGNLQHLAALSSAASSLLNVEDEARWPLLRRCPYNGVQGLCIILLYRQAARVVVYKMLEGKFENKSGAEHKLRESTECGIGHRRSSLHG